MPGGIGPGCLLQLCEIPVELADHECGSCGMLQPGDTTVNSREGDGS
jgi:hypothetical protein